MILAALVALLSAAPDPGPAHLQAAYARARSEFRIAAVAPDIVLVEGQIADGDEGRFLAALRPDTRTILINSVGGEVAPALDMAEEIERRGLRVVVAGACISSCANYLFAAAAERLVLPGGGLLWHGGPTPEIGRQMETQLRAMAARQGSTPAQLDEVLRRESERLTGLMRRQDDLYARNRLDTAVLYKLNEFGTEHAPVSGAPASGASEGVVWIAFDALGCAGFDVRAQWAPADAPGWQAFGRDARLPTSGISRSPSLERALCRRPAVHPSDSA